MSTEVTVGCYTASAVSTALVVDLNGFQNILSIICMVITILGITIPAVIKLVAKIKRYYEDKKLTPDELDDIAEDVKDIIDDVNDELKK